MNKRTLMLSAAAAALLTTPALAVGPTTISTVVTTAQKTSTTGDLTIASTGGINFKSATVPMLTIDSSNAVNNGGAFQGAGQDTQTAVEIDTSAASLSGSFITNGTIDLSGTGANKVGFHLAGTNAFTGNVTFDANSVVSITGDTSTGIETDLGSTLNGDLLIGGTMTMQPTSANETTSSGIVLANLAGTIKGNVIVSTGAALTAIGNNAQGINITGAIMGCDATIAACDPTTEIGTFSNSGSISVAGVSIRQSNTTNAEGGSALTIGNSIAGGVLNNGPTSGADTTNTVSSIAGNGVNSAVVVFTPEVTSEVHIGVDTADSANSTYSFINRGSISAGAADPNKSVRTILMAGLDATNDVKFDGGMLNSGIVSATATSVTPGSPVAATALEIDSFVTLPQITASAQSTSLNASYGSFTASISGTQGGVATAIIIGGGSSTALATGTSVPTINVEAGAHITATAEVTDPTDTSVSTLAAIAIEDRSNSLTTINNAGTISATVIGGNGITVTSQTNGVTAVAAHAVDASLNTVGLDFTNNGLVNGDVLFGSGSDTYTVESATASPAAPAVHDGAINFGGTPTGGHDLLHVGQYGTVTGAITSQGSLNVEVDNNATLTVQNVITNTSNNLQVNDLTVAGGGTNNAATLNITVSQGGINVPVIEATDQVNFGSGANLHVDYGSFINTGGTFGLISAPTGHLGITAADVASYSAAVGAPGTLPYLLNDAKIVVANDGAGNDVLELIVHPKTVQQLGLTGYAASMFPIANVAIQQDNTLGAAMVAGIGSSSDAQKAYDAFVPDVSGGTRAIAISLTDQGTGVVAARERALRLFGKQPGELTLWGNEFGEYISNKGGNVTQTGGTAAAEPGFKDHGFGFSLGMDEGSASDGWYGLAFTFYTGDVAEGGDRVSTSNTLWYMLTGYSDWRGKGLFFDSQFTVGYGNIKGKREIVLTEPVSVTLPSGAIYTREADSKRAAELASLGFTLGANLRYGALTMIPQLSVDGMSMREEGYTEENGGTGFDLTVNPYYGNSLRAFLGSEFRGDLNLGDFYLQPSARIGYRFDFINDPTKLHAAFADIDTTRTGNLPGASFIVQGPDPSRGNYLLGLNLAATTDDWTIGLDYDFVRGTNNQTEQVGTISLLGRI